MREHRYPLGELAKAMGVSINQACIQLSIGGGQRDRYVEGMSIDVADRKAIKAGFHPFQVWPEMLDHILDELDFLEAEQAYRKQETLRARWREQSRRYLKAHPAARERARLYKLAWYQENRELVCKKERARYWENPERARDRKRKEREDPNVRAVERERSRRYYEEHAEELRAKERARKAARRKRRAEALERIRERLMAQGAWESLYHLERMSRAELDLLIAEELASA